MSFGLPYQECGCHLKYVNRETKKERKDERRKERRKQKKQRKREGREGKRNTMKDRKKYQWLHKLMHTKTFVCCNYCTHISSYVFYSFTSSDLDFSTKETRKLRARAEEREKYIRKVLHMQS